MAIINSKYNISNGTDFETHHFETNAKQVLLDENGNTTLKDIILGTDHDGQSLSIFKEQGVYLVSNSTDLPSGVSKTEKYLLEVRVVGDVVWQYLYEHKGNNVYVRSMTKLGFSKWALGGKSIQDFIDNTNTSIADLFELELQTNTKLEQFSQKLAIVVDKLEENVVSHNHDERYVPKTGGVFTGGVQITKDSAILGRQSNGSTFNIVKTTDGKLITVGGKGSVIQIDADIAYLGNNRIVDVVEAKDIASNAVEIGLAKSNKFTGNQTITKGRLLFDNSNGLTSSVGFNGGTGTNFTIDLEGRERVKVDTANVTVTGGFIVEGTYAKMRQSGVDEGLGVQFTSSKLNVIDFANNQKNIFTIERASGEVAFSKNSIKLGGRRLSVSSTAPLNPTTGDIWIG